MRYIPKTIDYWLAAASARATDALNLYEKRRFVAAIYLSGYVVECRLKALLIINGNKPPTRGPKGHDLRGLVEGAGFRLSDIRPPDRRQFLEHWSTDLRYQACLPSGMDHASLFEAAKGLSGWLANRVKRPHRRRRRT
ncbi:MAG: HEPN domain-containing protein [Deltaproteobacteria bacterium]|nr:HEPN domain-containing protein [Deltaproteobacteria bacterium]